MLNVNSKPSSPLFGSTIAKIFLQRVVSDELTKGSFALLVGLVEYNSGNCLTAWISLLVSRICSCFAEEWVEEEKVPFGKIGGF